MDTVSLTAQQRGDTKAKQILADGHIPAIIYGPALEQESQKLMVEYQEFRKAFRHAGESTIIHLTVEGKELPVLVHSIDFHPVAGTFEHIDFYAVDMKKKVHTHIPLVFVGNAPVVKEKNAILVHSKDQVEVECLPKDLIHHIEVDISSLEEYHDHIAVGALNVPDGITILDDPESNVISAAAPKTGAADDGSAEAEGAEGEEKGEGGAEAKKE